MIFCMNPLPALLFTLLFSSTLSKADVEAVITTFVDTYPQTRTKAPFTAMRRNQRNLTDPYVSTCYLYTFRHTEAKIEWNLILLSFPFSSCVRENICCAC